MRRQSFVVFICEHGAAKSVVAAAYFNKLAVERNLNIRAIARGTTPDAELSPKAVAGLDGDGLTPDESIPQKLSPADIQSASRVVTFCELPEEYQGSINTESWDNVPPVSDDYEKARGAIEERLTKLIDEIF